jgi:uncharacterized protein
VEAALSGGAGGGSVGRVIRVSLFSAVLWATGCQKTEPPADAGLPAAPHAQPASNAAPPTATPSDEPRFHLNRAQVGLPRVKLWLGAKELNAELCTTVSQVATGLMFRESIGPEESMLFAFGRARERAFYMRNVPFDIDVAYIDPEGVIQEIVRLKARDERPVPSKSANIQFVLEVAPDYFTKNGLAVGTLIRLERGGLREMLAPMAQLE